jgi:hypothetical protein
MNTQKKLRKNVGVFLAIYVPVKDARKVYHIYHKICDSDSLIMKEGIWLTANYVYPIWVIIDLIKLFSNTLCDRTISNFIMSKNHCWTLEYFTQ